MRKEATKVKFVIFHEELEVSSAVCSGMAGQKLLGANFWPDANEIAGSSESESFLCIFYHLSHLIFSS